MRPFLIDMPSKHFCLLDSSQQMVSFETWNINYTPEWKEKNLLVGKSRLWRAPQHKIGNNSVFVNLLKKMNVVHINLHFCSIHFSR